MMKSILNQESIVRRNGIALSRAVRDLLKQEQAGLDSDKMQEPI